MRTTNRRGFTLLELLVVIALLAILSALSVGAFFKIRSAQEGVATDQLLTKINTALDRQWSAARDQADKEFRENNLPGNNSIDTLVSFAGEDRDRARALWVHLRLKNEFPQNFYEARTATRLEYPAGTTIVSLPARKTFTANAVVAADTSTAPPTVKEVAAAQSAGLLYIIVSEKASRGEAFGDEALGGGQNMVRVGTTSYDMKAFSDVWFTPIGFVRSGTNLEIQGPPYGKTTGNRDPLDPLGKLTAATWLPAAKRTAAASWIYRNQATGLTALPNANWLPTAISAGPDKIFDSSTWVPATAGASPGLTDVLYNTDDLLGYRVKREGSKGES